MFKKAWSIALTDLISLWKDKLSFLWLIFLPILWITMMSAVTGGGDGKIPLGIVLQDQGILGQALLKNISELKGIEVEQVKTEEELTQLVREGSISLGLVIPINFSANIQENQKTSLKLILSKRQSTYFLEALIYKELQRIESQSQAASFSLKEAERIKPLSSEQKEEFWRDAFQSASNYWQKSGLKVEYSTVEKEEGIIPEGAHQSSPGFTIMFVLFGLFLGAGSLVEERRAWTLARILTTPTSRTSLLSGKFLAYFLVGLIQFSILVLYGQFVLGVDYGSSILGVAAVGICFVLASVGLSTLLASLARTHGQAEAFAILLANVLGMLGGSWWPLEIVPPALQTVAKFTPVYWGVYGLHKLITYNQGLSSILVNLYVLLGFAAVSLLLSILLFRYE
ncbi:MAG: ABC transporter permease [Coprothermobacterota bacterium]|nr:ABC transporter permease [Coprothermobacterota bacterium]